MMKSNRSLVRTLVVLLIFLGFSEGVQADERTQEAVTYIQNLADTAVKALTPSDVTTEQKKSRCRELLQAHFDIKAIGEWVLGRHWRTATPKQRKDYLFLYEKYIVDSYVDRFNRYAGEKLEISGATASKKSKEVIVHSTIYASDGREVVMLDWNLVANDRSDFQIIDVLVDKVSLRQTQRDEFGSFIRRNNGDFEALLSEMRKRLNARG
jgi:phospholipid transport system substrate-binding protein